MTTSKRGRPPTGCPWFNPATQQWEARILKPNGGRKPVPMPGIAEHETERAHALAKQIALRAREGGFVPEEATETCEEYFGRWLKARVAAGIRTTYDDNGRWRKWVSPHLGTKPIVGVTKRDVQLVVAALDGHVRAGRMAWKTAVHVWGLVTKLFDDAHRSKEPALCVRGDNPTREVRGPDRGHNKAGAFLFPSELDALLRCERIPLARRRAYALAVYLGVRAGELRALEWEDVSESGYVHVHRAVDRRTHKAKPTKTGITRRVAIEPTLAPLLETMREESGGKGSLVTVPSWDLADVLQADMRAAGLDRRDLFADDETRRPLNFHDLRHTYGTWRAIRGDDLLRISRAMGHTTTKMTERYINEAEVFDLARFGVPFGPLPELRRNSTNLDAKSAKLQWPLRGSKAQPTKPEASSGNDVNAEKQAIPSIGDAASAEAIQDTSGRPDLESALRQAIAAAVLAGDDATADNLRAMLESKRRSSRLRRVK